MIRKKQETNRGMMFLLELALAIVILGLCSAACVRLFVTAGYVAEQTKSQDETAFLASGLAEKFLASKIGEDPSVWLGTSVDADGRAVLYYDGEWNPVDSRDLAEHELVVRVWEEDGFRKASFTQQERSYGFVPEELFTAEQYIEGRSR